MPESNLFFMENGITRQEINNLFNVIEKSRYKPKIVGIWYVNDDGTARDILIKYENIKERINEIVE
jgi:hypothetical protein